MLSMFTALRDGVIRSLRLSFPRFQNGTMAHCYSTLNNHVCGFKVKARLRRRCKDCYIVVRDQRSYVICPTHPRHKQMSLVKKEKYTWTLTGASQSKIRPW